MRNKNKFDFECFVHWIIFISIISGLLGLIIQLIRFGSIMELGGISRPAGF